MNPQIEKFARECGAWNQVYGDKLFLINEHFDFERFAQLIVTECARFNQEQSHELSGVIIDTEEGDGFDQVCLRTVKRVHDYLAGNQLKEYFGIDQ